MEAVCFSETLLPTYEPTRCHNPEEQHVVYIAMRTSNLTSLPILSQKLLLKWDFRFLRQWRCPSTRRWNPEGQHLHSTEVIIHEIYNLSCMQLQQNTMNILPVTIYLEFQICSVLKCIVVFRMLGRVRQKRIYWTHKDYFNASICVSTRLFSFYFKIIRSFGQRQRTWKG
jgi:hypothetical protein